MNERDIYEKYRASLAELSAKHAEILRENTILAERLRRLEQTLALLRAQRNHSERT
jgi:hypothetical protein